MLERKPIFPNIIEVNHQLGHVLGCNVYLVYDGPQHGCVGRHAAGRVSSTPGFASDNADADQHAQTGDNC